MPVALASRVSERERIEASFHPIIREDLDIGRLVSYAGNKTVPFLRLYRYKEAFSIEFVNRVLDYFGASRNDIVFDPFSGLGTTLFASMLRGIPSVGVDRLPVAAFAADTLPKFFTIKPGSLLHGFNDLARELDRHAPAEVALDVPLMRAAFDDATLHRLRQWKSAIATVEPPLREVLRLLLLAILEETSYTSNDGQFLRMKRDKKPLWPDDALLRRVEKAEEDLTMAPFRWPEHTSSTQALPRVAPGDTRCLDGLEFSDAPTILITSPPYVNRYDYTRSYCLELCFDFVRNFEELRALRHSILRSHIESKTDPEDQPPHPVISEVVENLKLKSLNNPRIPYMITAYFVDMEKAIREWSRVLRSKSLVAMVVDNVRFEGEMIPVDLVLSEMAERHGFTVEEVIVARYKGNSSQQMGKYGRVRVRESVVIWSTK